MYADWLFNHRDRLTELPPVILIDDPRLDHENFKRQMSSIYDRQIGVIVLTAENEADWTRNELNQVPIYDEARTFGLRSYEGEATELVENLKLLRIVELSREQRERIIEEIRQVEGTSGYFSEIVKIASSDVYRPIPIVVQERLAKAAGTAEAGAFERLYELVCVPFSVGLALPESAAHAMLPLDQLSEALRFNGDMPNPPIRREEQTLAAGHERHAQQFLQPI